LNANYGTFPSLAKVMRRRDFMTAIGGAAVAWPLAARAQQGGKLPRLGILSPGRSELPEPGVTMLDAFVQGLHELGYAEGRNVILERRFAEWRPLKAGMESAAPSSPA
jgi:putative ABC transport system substrate-binding protein